MIELKKIRLSETLELPYICDLNVLMLVQDKYGTVLEFEKRIAGFEIKDEQTFPKEPDIAAVIFGLEAMICEGMDIDKKENGNIYPISNMNELHVAIERDYRKIARDLHIEMMRCFKVKK